MPGNPALADLDSLRTYLLAPAARGIVSPAEKAGINAIVYRAMSQAGGDKSLAIGYSASAAGINSTAIGNFSAASDVNALAMGIMSTALGNLSLAGGWLRNPSRS